MSHRASWANQDGSTTIVLVEKADFPGTAAGPVRHGESTHPAHRGLRSVTSLVHGDFAHLTSDAIEVVRRRERERTAPGPVPMFFDDAPTVRLERIAPSGRVAARVRPYPTGAIA